MGMREKTCANPLKEQGFFPVATTLSRGSFPLFVNLPYLLEGWKSQLADAMLTGGDLRSYVRAETTILRTYGHKWVCLRP